VKFSQRRAFVHRDVVRLVARDLILRLFFAGVVGVAFVVDIFGVHLDDSPADMARLGVPGHVIADPEGFLHGASGVVVAAPSGAGLKTVSAWPSG